MRFEPGTAGVESDVDINEPPLSIIQYCTLLAGVADSQLCTTFAAINECILKSYLYVTFVLPQNCIE